MKTLTLLITFITFQSLAGDKWKEADYVNYHCKGYIEYILQDKTRIDCLTDDYAIEYDYSHKWAESVAQSLYYSYMTSKKAGIVLIIDEKHKGRYLKRLQSVIDMIPCKPKECPAIKVWTIIKRGE